MPCGNNFGQVTLNGHKIKRVVYIRFPSIHQRTDVANRFMLMCLLVYPPLPRVFNTFPKPQSVFGVVSGRWYRFKMVQFCYQLPLLCTKTSLAIDGLGQNELQLNLKKVRPKYFCALYNYAGKVDLNKGY